MDGRHKDILRVNRVKLTRAIPRGTFKDVVEDIYCRGTISQNMKDDILCERTQRDQICLFLDILRTRDAEAFDDFYNALVDFELGTAADLLKPEAANTRQQRHRHDVQESCPFNPVQQVQNVTLDDDLKNIKEWPLKERCTEDYPDKIDLKSDICSEMNVKYKKSCLESDELIYKMSAKVRGYVLVINNKHFDDPTLDTRHGTEVDAKAIEVLFTQLKFKVEIHADLTHEKIEELLQDFGAKKDHSKFDCFICFILSHGVEESVVCVDGKQFPLQNIFDYFNGHNCPSLLEKPKIFFIQACKQVNNSQEKTDAINAVQHKDVDFIKCFSTTLGEVSYRYNYGSRFIYTWIYTIEKWAYKFNLMDLQTRMNNLMQKFKSDTQTLQTGETRTTSGKEFYFFPGLHVDKPASMTATVQDPPGPQMTPPDTQLAAPGNGQRHIGGATYQASDENELIRGHVKTTELDTQLPNQPEVRASIREEKAVVTFGESMTEDLAASSNINQSVASSSAATSGAENNMLASINITRQVDP